MRQARLPHQAGNVKSPAIMRRSICGKIQTTGVMCA